MQISPSELSFAAAILRPALALSPGSYLEDLRARMRAGELQQAVAEHNTAVLFDWLIGLIQLQGVSDAVAFGFSRDHGIPTWHDITEALSTGAHCPRLRCYWSFDDCEYQKTARTCAEPGLLSSCLVPALPARNGRLSQAAVSLYLFVRDVCGGDLVTWLDRRLAEADAVAAGHDRGAGMRSAVVEPLGEVHGVSRKVLSMTLADLMLGADPDRERWVATGASMIAIDSLVHNFLHRTGILRRLEAEHPYGERCYRPGGCAEVIEAVSREIDARKFGSEFPACFPRFVQQAIWRFCAAGEHDICNGNRIDDRGRCRNRFCPAYENCDRVRLHSG